MNLAAVHYHFGSKEALLEAVVQRRVAPVNGERLAWLDRLEAAGGKAPLDLEEVLEAFLAPPVLTFGALGERGRLVAHLFARVYFEGGDEPRRVLLEQFRQVVARFGAALRRALPEHPEDVLLRRLLYVGGVLMHVLAASEQIDAIAPVPLSDRDPATALARMLPFVAAGMRAPVPELALRKRRAARGGRP